MEEEFKYDISDTKAMLTPFTQMSLAMETVFNNTKNHGISIREIWDQINKLKDATGLNKTKDGIDLSNKEVPKISATNINVKPIESSSGLNITDQNSKQPTTEPHNSESKNSESKIDSLIATINAQSHKLEKLETRLDYLSNRTEDKFDDYSQEINKLIKSRLDDLENQYK